MNSVTCRKNTRPVKVGNLIIGGSNQVIIQSMCTTKTTDVKKTIAQINRLIDAGCQLVRVAVYDMEAAKCLSAIKSKISIPLVADIHFDYRLALEAVEQGVDKIRINPGNIGRNDRVAKIVKACKKKGIPIRIGINAGSLEKKFLKQTGSPTAQGMVDSALENIRLLEEFEFYDIIISLKASSIPLTIEAYKLASTMFNYPLHLGITESGALYTGMIKSAAGLGVLLHLGLGNTMRVSLSANPVEEIRVARIILKMYGLIEDKAILISCPTCGRVQIDLISIANEIESYIEKIKMPITVAVMGCSVNGPGEAKKADIGLTGRNGKGVLFKKGQIIKTVPENKMIDELKIEINQMHKQFLQTGIID
ncbi:MAG: flavodoxin-dependent (E)-4-hydroxy-3-methylbut-2-enyl-diphosphate synthase [Streptococcaceae bacterium]|jgi:(E)-4-hydroxy-3-methylbut-2-enyl-diphosphate synthase|nr:flavodoxin-dependent (E)-4-hydroxy-3-methylbut-2-enyl-diphosphate synthase [Streptococcaceae bacterium]